MWPNCGNSGNQKEKGEGGAGWGGGVSLKGFISTTTTHLCLSQNVAVLDGKALCGAEGVLGVFRKGGGDLQKRREEDGFRRAAAPRAVTKTTRCTHVYDEVLHRQRPREKRHVISKFVFVLLDGGRRKRARQSNMWRSRLITSPRGRRLTL